MKKVLITGSKGMLGTDLVAAFKDSYDVIPCTRMDFDITDITGTIDFILNIKPDLVIHAAAFTDVDGCESEVSQAYRVNALGARNVAIACNRLNIPLVYISTDYVFNGNYSNMYKEDSPTNPINIYGKTKLAGENFIKDILSKYYIVRTSWLYGHNGKNFIKTVLRLAKEKKKLKMVADQTGCPTYTKDLAEAILKLVEKPTYGVFHITNSNYCTWFEFAKEILLRADIDKKIEPITTDELNRAADRPRYSMLDNFHWQLEGYEPLRNYHEALDEYLKDALN